MPLRIFVYGTAKHNAAEFFEAVVVPIWQRFTNEMIAVDLCCAAIVLLDQMPDWIAAETGEDPSDVRVRLVEKDPHFHKLNLAARVIKHREIDRGPNRGLSDVLTDGARILDDGTVMTPLISLPDGESIKADVLLKSCMNIVAGELGVKIPT